MGIMDKIKGTFKKDLTPEEQYRRDVEAADRRQQAAVKDVNKRREQIANCRMVMHDCERTFNITIDTERDIATKKRRIGSPVERERERVRMAAIGLLVTDMALLELDSISSEADMNSAMNQMGKALKQLVRLDNRIAGISESSRKFIDMFYPGIRGMIEETENYTSSKRVREIREMGEAKDIATMYEIPAEVRDRIDDTFVDNLMSGDSYKMAMFKSVNLQPEVRVTDEVERFASSSGVRSRVDSILGDSEEIDLSDIAIPGAGF